MPKHPNNLDATRIIPAGTQPMRPTKRQRHAVEVAVSIGLTVDQIAAAIEIGAARCIAISG